MARWSATTVARRVVITPWVEPSPGKGKRSKAVPVALLTEQTNARGVLAGPFLNHAPRLPVVNSVGGRDCP